MRGLPALLPVLSLALAQTVIPFWHTAGPPGDRVLEEAIRSFNAGQNAYRLEARYVGDYREAGVKLLAALRSGRPPALFHAELSFLPRLAKEGLALPLDAYLQDLPQDLYPAPLKAGQVGGRTYGLPLGVSVPALYYNKDAYKAAGLDPEKAPTTWPEVALAAAKLKASGHKCPLTIAWQGWTQLESFSAWHNVEFATKQNGLGGMDARMRINTPLHVRHIENLGNMAKQGLFVYKGRRNVPEPAFISGECAMVTTSTGFYGNVKNNAKFNWGLSTLPYYPDVTGAPQNTVIGGASLWTLAGKKPDEYKGVAAFFNFISQPEIAARTHQETGYLPVTNAAFALTEKSGFYKKNPGTDVGPNQMIRKVTDKSRGIRLGNYVQIRDIEDEELEQVWAGKKSAKEALDSIVKRGNEQLERFEKANKG